MELGKWARLNVGSRIGAPDMCEQFAARADGYVARRWRDLTDDRAETPPASANCSSIDGRWMSADGSTRQMFVAVVPAVTAALGELSAVESSDGVS